MLASHLVAFLQKFKKFKEFLKNSLNFLQFSAKFSNTFTKIRKILKQLSQNESKFPTKVRSTKKARSKNLLCSLNQKKVRLKSSLNQQNSLTKSSLVQKVRLKKLTQKPTARAALHTAGWCLPAPSRKSHFGLKCCILRNSRFPQQNPHLL